MTAHDCTTFNSTCYRCDLSRDETSPYPPPCCEAVESKEGREHAPDCYRAGPRSPSVTFVYTYLRPDAENDLCILTCELCGALVRETKVHEAWHSDQ